MFKRWLDIPQNRSCLILGPRRCGKTTLLRHRYPDLKYVTLDDLDLLVWARRDPKGFVTSLEGSAIIDEIQRLPILTVAVKYAVDNENARFLMTGSSNLGLLDAVADTLAGRIDILALPT
ncbi:MAG: AAA family ATPase, partial [Nitrospinales bacterium]